MSAAMRQMHLGVFVLGTGNHSAGWRYEAAATSNNQLAVIREIARIAERGRPIEPTRLKICRGNANRDIAISIERSEYGSTRSPQPR